MSHAHDKTLLSSLGFADPDKREPLHDRGCQFIGSKATEIAQRLYCSNSSGLGKQERIITKGSDRYKQTIGFVDVQIDISHPLERTEIIEPCTCCSKKMHTRSYCGKCRREPISGPLRLIVEVKIQVVPVSTVVRQLSLYCEYLTDYGKNIPILAAPWDLKDVDKKTLSDSKISFIHLGDGFRKFIAEHDAPTSASPDLSL